MPDPPSAILLVTPVWDDSVRLACFGSDLARVLAEKRLPVRWVIADDGSCGDERVSLERLAEDYRNVYPHVGVHHAAKHRGKGAVVREAWGLAPEAEWLAFVDADGSVSAREMIGLIKTAVVGGKSVLGIRKRTSTTQVVESFWRGLAHRGYLLVARLLLGLRCEDVQCGAKVIRGEDFRRIAPMLMEDGLAFDSELLATLGRHGMTWTGVAVNWTEKENGKVRVWRDAWGMLRALIRLRRRVE